MKGGIDTAIRIEPGDVAALYPVDARKLPADQNLAVRLHRNRGDKALLLDQRVEGRVNASARAQAAEKAGIAAEHNPPVSLNDNSVDRRRIGRRWVERRIQTVDIQTREAAARCPVDGLKAPAGKHFPVRQQDYLFDRAVGRIAGIERSVETPVRIQPGEPQARRAVVVGKIPADDDFIVRLNGDGFDVGISAGAGIKRGVERAVGVESGNVSAGSPRKRSKIAADKNFAVWLHCQRVNETIRPYLPDVESGIEAAVRIQPGKVAARRAVKVI